MMKRVDKIKIQEIFLEMKMEDPNNNGNNIVVPKKKNERRCWSFYHQQEYMRVILAMIKWSFNILQDDPSIDLKN